MRATLAKLTKLDWVSVFSVGSLVFLTFLPIFWDVDTSGGWLRNAVITLAAVALTSIVIAQIALRGGTAVSLETLGRIESTVSRAIDKGAVHEVPAKLINDELTDMLKNAKEWYFRGGSARWQRETVLPSLAAKTDQPVRYNVQIISPFDPELCAKYARYRKQSRPDDPRADPEQISMELLGFLYAISVWAARSKISPDVTLLHRFSPFRLDGSSETFLITVADMKKNGLKTSAGNWYHASLLDEFAFEAGYATKLKLPLEAQKARGGESVETFFKNLRMQNPSATATWKTNYTQVDYEAIYELGRVENV